jgi:hypothetical protein
MLYYFRVVPDNTFVRVEQDPEVVHQVEVDSGSSGFPDPFVCEEPEYTQVEGKPRFI